MLELVSLHMHRVTTTLKTETEVIFVKSEQFPVLFQQDFSGEICVPEFGMFTRRMVPKLIAAFRTVGSIHCGSYTGQKHTPSSTVDRKQDYSHIF